MKVEKFHYVKLKETCINFLSAVLKVYYQSNPIISANWDTKTFKNVTLKNKILSSRSRSEAPATSKTEVLVTLVISKKLLTKIRKSSITDVAGLLDTASKIKLPKKINRNITKQKNNAIKESLILISFSVK